MNAQPIATKLIPVFSSCSLALSAMLTIRAVSRFFWSHARGLLSGRRLQRLLLPILLCGMGAALPAQAAVTQSPGNDVSPPGTPVLYEVTATVPQYGYVHIGVQNNGGDITTQLVSNSCGDASVGVIYCNNDSGVYDLGWVPPAGINNLAFSETVYNSDGGIVSQATENLTTIVVGAVASGLTPGSDLTLLPNLTPNQIAVAGAVTDLCSTSTNPIVQTQCDNLYALPPAEIQNALQQMVPDQLAAQGTNAIVTAFTQMSNISQRLLALRNKSSNTMLALNGLMLAVNGQSIPLGMLADAAAASSSIANSGRLGGFVKGRIQLGSSDTTTNAAGYDFNTKGLTAGVDYRLSDQVVLGGALGYANSKNDYSSSRGDMKSDGTTLSFYGSYYAPQDMYLDWIASYGNNNYDSTRNLVYSGANTQTQGSTDGRQLGLSVSFGKDMSRGAWLFTPYVRAEYVEAKVNGYNESGGSGLALSYDDQTVHSFISAAAARVSKTISARSGVYTPGAHLEWEHQYRDDQRMITARFMENPSSQFQISTDSPDRNYFNLGLSMAATWPGGRSGFVSYEMVLGHSYIRNYTFDFGVRQEF
jgi:outer membrane autotransporter protein